MRTSHISFGRHSPAARRVLGVAMALATCLTPLTLAAQAAPTIVEYDVEFSTQGSLLDLTCSATGTDVLRGTLVGYEPVPRNETKAYVGTLLRSTGISICGSRRNATSGTDVVCSMSITGDGAVEVILEIQGGQAEGYLKYLDNRAQWARLLAMRSRPAGPLRPPSVTGTCDPQEMADMQNEYAEGSTGGSPSGQPIDITVFPPPSYPHTFAPIDTRRTIWTLKVLARRP